jgi:phage-related protein
VRELAFERLHRPGHRKRHFEVREAQAELEGPQSREQQQIEAAQIERASRAPDPGDPLAPALRTELEQKFGRDLGHIRVHTGTDSSSAALTANAVAFTRGAHVYLAAPSLAREPHVMAHEITHTVHQGAAPNLRFAGQPRTAARGGTARHAVPHRASAPASVHAGPAKPAQKLDIWEAAKSVGGSVSSGIRSAAGKVVNVGADLLSKGKEAVFGVIREIAPDFLDMFQGEGIVGFVKKLAERAFRSLFDGLMAPLRKVIDVDALQKKFSDVRAWVGTISAQLAKNDCSGVLAAAKKIGEFFSKSLQPVADAVKAIGAKVGDFFSSIWNSIGAPLFDLLKKAGGEIWNSLTGFMKDVGKLIKRVREALGSTWTSVKGWLGIKAEDGEGEGGGLWNWIKEKAKAASTWIEEATKPIIGPLKKVGTVMLLLVPGGQIVAIMTHWPQLKAGYEALAQKWDDLNLLPRAREALANQILPRVMKAAEAMGQKLIAGADWLLEKLDDFHGALASVAQVTAGVLSPMKRVIDFAREQSHKMIQWARDKLKYASTNLHSLLLKFIAFMGRVGEALKKLIAAVVNPFGIVGFLAGTIWLALPECLKGPIIEFLLDVLDRFIAALPTNPLLGILWPIMKAALTGFVKRVKKVPLKEKIELADKIAKIISGQSFDFAIGYLKGIVLGIWEELTAPFRALAAIFDLPEKIKKFLNDLGTSFCEIVEKIRCFLATLAASAFGKLDDLLATLQEYLENPKKILDLLTCAAEGALSAVESLGSTIADEMIKIFKESDSKLGERLGKFTGGIIVQAVISFFTAGAGAGASIAAKVVDALGAAGKAMAQVLKFITTQLNKLIKFVKGFVAKIGRAIVKGAKSLFGKMKGFFGKIFAWFKRVFGKLFAKIKKKFMLTAEERLAWQKFQRPLVAEVATHKAGITRKDLKVIFKRHLQGAKKVAKWPSFITKHGPHWRLWVRQVKSIKPRIVAKAMLDPKTRLKQTLSAVRDEVKGLKRRGATITSSSIKASFPKLERKYQAKLTNQFNKETDSYKVVATVNPTEAWQTQANRPKGNDVKHVKASQHVIAHTLSSASSARTPATGSPTHWSAIEKIRSKRNRTSLYIRGHLVSGYFGPGSADFTTPITRSSNGTMASLETKIKKELKANFSKGRPVYKYEVEGVGTPTDNPPKRFIGGKHVDVPEEKLLHKEIVVNITRLHYDDQKGTWSVPQTSQKPSRFKNVPEFPVGYNDKP